MSHGIAIRVESVSKEFRIYERPSDRLWELLTRRPRHSTHRALDSVDLTVAKGETVGIVGRNGSGKSTLLQIIAGTLRPTSGKVAVDGRVAPLLELGSGFNPEFSGRENVLLNAQVIGLHRHEVEERFERIADFADIGDFMEQPVRTYSSGMLVRLAFAVAINTDPDILIIDEALAVGDESFQRKCFSKIESLKESGATILFVSHSAASVVQLCDRAALMELGQCLMVGTPKQVVGAYQRMIHAHPDAQQRIRHEIRELARSGKVDIDDRDGGQCRGGESVGHRARMSGDFSLPEIRPWPVEAEERLDPGLRADSRIDYAPRGAVIEEAGIVNPQGTRVNILLPGRPYRLVFRISFTADAVQVEFNMTIKSLEGIALYGASSHGFAGFLPDVKAGEVYEVEFSFDTRLLPGTYFYNVGCQAVPVGGDERQFLHRIIDAGAFRIEAGSSDRYKIGYFDLAVEPAARWRVLGEGLNNSVTFGENRSSVQG
ncbi:ABC transporter ATP-binding protein [Caldimonas sp.]|uniref:ABC transporter ATP-binding protein n=1 Tax=Caldimonas sp. TaxID=2838790 RepID=UPI00391B0618